MSPAARARPLAGLAVAVTRQEEPDGPLARRLDHLGARVLRWQAVRIEPPADPLPLVEALASLERFDWIVFASAHAVAAVAALLPVVRQPAGLRIAAVGSATAAAAARAGWRVDRVPARFGAAGLLAEFRAAGDAPGARALLPASASGRQELVDGLRALGAAVDRLDAYRVVPVALDRERCLGQLAAGEVDAMLFTSPSAVTSVAEALGPASMPDLLGPVFVVTIGPTTTEALRRKGVEPAAEATPSTLDGLVAALVAAARERLPGRARDSG